MSKFLVYALVDPFTKEWRYIGKSCSGKHRCYRHWTVGELAQSHTYKSNWVRACLFKGLKPEIVILEEFDSIESMQGAEEDWIAAAREAGVRLTNLTDGGEGTTGSIQSAETRRKRSEALRGRPKSDSVKEAMRAAAMRPETRARKSLALRGRKKSEAHMLALRASWAASSTMGKRRPRAS